MKPEDAIKRLNEMKSGMNDEIHEEADNILLEVLRELGQDQVATAWEDAKFRVKFWYS